MRLCTSLIRRYMQRKVARELDFPFTQDVELPKAPQKQLLLYLHIPFCKNLCPYCSFHKYMFDEERMREYFSYLKKEISFAKKMGFEFNELYIGGGTPTLLPKELAALIDFVKELWDIETVSCESDPNLSKDGAEILKSRIDRLSIGIQTFDDGLLKKMGRYKKFGSAKEQFEKAKFLSESFPILNCDFIFNLPGQSLKMLERDLEWMLDLAPQQLSIYPLMCSPLVRQNVQKRLGKIDESREFGYYKMVVEYLEGAYEQISAWSFAKRGAEVFDEYVVDNEDYLGLGSGAFSFVEDRLYVNEFALDRYEMRIDQNSLATARTKSFDRRDLLLYRTMLMLFGLKVDKEQLLERFGDHKLLVEALFAMMRFCGMIDKERLTLYGKYIFMLLMKEFYIGMDRVRESSRKGINKYGISA